MASLRKRIKLVPGNALWALREQFSSLNSRQLEGILKDFLSDSQVKITRLNKSPSSTEDFRIGLVAGVFLAIALRNDIESALTCKERCINQLAKFLLPQDEQGASPAQPPVESTNSSSSTV